MSLTVEVVSPEGQRIWVTHKVARLLVPRGFRTSTGTMYGEEASVGQFDWLKKATVAQVLEWVGGNQPRAEAAIEVERTREPIRDSLIGSLELVAS